MQVMEHHGVALEAAIWRAIAEHRVTASATALSALVRDILAAAESWKDGPEGPREPGHRLSPADLRRSLRLTPALAADAYREALASPDPRTRLRPTSAAAEKLGASRGHVSRLISTARAQGVTGLNPPPGGRRPGLPLYGSRKD